MKKKLMVIVMTMMMAVSIVACTNNQPAEPTKPSQTEETKGNEETKATEETKANEETNGGNQEVSDDITAKLADAIIKALGENNGFDVDVASDEMFTVGLYDLDLSKVNAIVAKQNAISSVNPDTLVIVDCKDGYADTVLGYLKENYDSQKSYQELYPFAVEKVNGARIYQQDNLVIYVIAGGYTPEEGIQEFVDAEYEKVDAAIESILGTLPANLAE